jgi:HEAT repeat protein
LSFDTVLAELADMSRPVRASSLTGLSSLGPAEASRFLDVWLALPGARRRQVVSRLVDLAEDNIELNFDAVYFIALADAEAEVRLAAVRGLWEYEGRDLINHLIGLLRSDPDARVRAEAALGLGRFALLAEFGKLPADDAERVDAALRRTAEDISEPSEVRGRALEALGARSLPWVTELIRAAYAGNDRRLRVSAVHAMGRSCDARWLADVIRELSSDDPEFRFEAATASGAIGDEAAVPHLIPLLHDADAEVQEAAIHALGEIGGREAKKALEQALDTKDERVREAVQEALAEADFYDDPLGFRLR